MNPEIEQVTEDLLLYYDGPERQTAIDLLTEMQRYNFTLAEAYRALVEGSYYRQWQTAIYRTQRRELVAAIAEQLLDTFGLDVSAYEATKNHYTPEHYAAIKILEAMQFTMSREEARQVIERPRPTMKSELNVGKVQQIALELLPFYIAADWV